MSMQPTQALDHHALRALAAGPLAQAIGRHAAAAYPAEACGLIVAAHASGEPLYWPCRNAAPAAAGADRFVLHPEDFAQAEDTGTVLAVLHTHPNASANPSMADRVGCERSGLPWLIVGWPGGHVVSLAPEGFSAPLVGREFAHGVLDCYTLIQDYYVRELGITLPDFDREDGWWERQRPGGPQELYVAGHESAGFVAVAGPPCLHDVIAMQVMADVVNHAGVYVGDGVLLHHLWGRLSCRDVYGGYWARHTRYIWRHRSLLGAA